MEAMIAKDIYTFGQPDQKIPTPTTDTILSPEKVSSAIRRPA